VVLTGDGRGGVEAAIKITDGRGPSCACLTIKMTFNQSYLPEIIRAIGRTFLGRT
jgi:hypothetical protein